MSARPKQLGGVKENALCKGLTPFPALLLLASVKTYRKNGAPDRLEQAKWYRRRKKDRATTGELISQLRREMWASALNPSDFPHFTSTSPPDQKSEKPAVPAQSAVFLSLS